MYLSLCAYTLVKKRRQVRLMFVKTIKVKKPGFVIFALAAAIFAAVLMILVLTGAGKGSEYTMKTEADRQAFLKEMGWETGKTYNECKVVIIPSEFNDVYKKYNDLQKEQGFDLERYKGKTVEIYTYEVKNYPGHEENIICTLMVYNDVLIGGDVSCIEVGGFMQGLMKPEK